MKIGKYNIEQEDQDNFFRKAGEWNYVTTTKFEWEE